MESGTSLGTEDEVARSQLFFAVVVSEDGTTAQDEEHLFSSEVHVQAVLLRAGGELVQRRPHSSVVRSPKDTVARSSLFVVSVPYVGEQVLTIHFVDLQS